MIGIRGAVCLSVFAVACGSAWKLVPFDQRFPHNYLIVHAGYPTDFETATCVEISSAEDTSHRIDAAKLLRRLVNQQLPACPICSKPHAPGQAVLTVEYHAGPGVCIDCGTGPSDPQSGFAFLELTGADGAVAATAEWQYWRGGTPEFMAQQFVSDLSNLIIFGVDKLPEDFPERKRQAHGR
jgi:hypothetical protein